MKTSIVILTKNKLDYTKQCLESIRKHTDKNSMEIIVVDNLSTDGTREWLRQQSDIRLIENEENKGFPAGCNQGMRIATGDNILLLNNDTIVTKNWLTNLMRCLYSSDEIGAVGAITNNCSYHQTIPVKYTSLEEMHVFASQINVSDPDKWEERLKLIGYCMLIKREVVEQIGFLDERFTPGNFEDDDYSHRIRLAGYKLMLCRDTFIHHYGSITFRDHMQQYDSLLKTNEEKFINKWGFHPVEATEMKYDMLQMIAESGLTRPFRVLEIGCGAGGMLLQLKNTFGNYVEAYGWEQQEVFAKLAQFAEVHIGNLEKDGSPYPDKFFDFILLSDDFTKANDPVPYVTKAKDLLRPDGRLLIRLRNRSHYKMLIEIMQGTWERSRQGNSYSLQEIRTVMHDCGFDITSIVGKEDKLTDSDEAFVRQLEEMIKDFALADIRSASFLIQAQPASQVRTLLQMITEQGPSEDTAVKLCLLDIGEVIDEINHFDQPIELLNLLATMNFQYGLHNYVLPYLYKAHALDEQHQDTIFNIAYVMNEWAEYEIAYEYIGKLGAIEDEEILQLKERIVLQYHIKNRSLENRKYLLRRLEYQVAFEESNQELINLLVSGEETEKSLIEHVERFTFDKEVVLNTLATICFQHEKYEYVLPFLEEAIQHNPANEDTLYNLGFVLATFEEYDLAIHYLEQIQNKDNEIMTLLEELRGRNNVG